MRKQWKLLPAGILLLLTASAGATGEKTADEIAKELANPNSPLATLNLKTQYNVFEGDLPGAHDQDSFRLIFQPVLPFPVGTGSRVLFRPSFSYTFDHDIFNAEEASFEGKNGFGDIPFDLLYVPKGKPGLLFGFGLVGSLPTATDGLGTKKWSFGPDVVLGKLGDSYVLGALGSHLWHVGGSGDAEINLSTINAFLTFLPGGGWNVGSAPIMSYDWTAEQWTVPLNLNLGKTITMGGRAWKLSLEVNHFIEHSDAFGQKWLFGFNIGPVVQNRLAGLFK